MTTEGEGTGAATPPMQPQPGAMTEPPKTSGMAIASIICAIAGFCTGITSIIGFILGIIALKQIRRSEGRLTGDGLAIGGIVISVVSFLAALFALFLMVGLTLPALAVAREAAQSARANAMAAMAAQTMVQYHTDYDRAFPPVDDWQNALATMNGATGFDNIEIDLAMNEHLDGMRAYEVPNPARTVMFFEVPDGSETVGGRDLLADEPHYPDGYLIVFVDSHTEYVPADQIDDLVWDPRSDNGN